MRFVPLLLAAALIAPPLQAQTAQSADDARAVLAAVLAHQVSIRGLESAAQTCVTAALAPPPVAAGEEDPMFPDHAVRIYFQWHVPEAPATIRPPTPRPPEGQRRRNRERLPPVVLPAAVPAELARQLDALRAEAARNTAAPAVAQVDAALLTPPMQLQEMNTGCAPLQLSAPGFAGDTAFVETAYACGTTCGNGSLYALQRREGRWQVVAVADTWIS
jgi:hypothetical protein